MIALVLIGVGFLVIGAWMSVTGSTFLIHGYHLVGVAPEDRSRLGRGVGLGTAICGVGVTLLGIALTLGQEELTDPLVIAGLAIVIAGVLLGCAAVVYCQIVLPMRRER